MDIQKGYFKNCESLRTMSSLETNISYISPLDNSLVTIKNNVSVKRKVSFNPQIEIIKVENLKHFNSRNNMIDDKIKNFDYSIDNLDNENELPKIKRRKNSENELMIQKEGKGNEINEKQKSKIISFYNDNILKFRLKERLKNIFTLGKLGNILTLYPDENGNPKIFIGPNIVIYIIMNILISLIFFDSKNNIFIFYNIFQLFKNY